MRVMITSAVSVPGSREQENLPQIIGMILW
jgi:hypothetical protein